MKGLGVWTRALDKTQRARPKARKKISKESSKGKALLSSKDQTSNLGESAAVHFVHSDLASFSDGASESDEDPAVVRTVETLSVAGVMFQHQHRRRRPGQQEGSHPDER